MLARGREFLERKGVGEPRLTAELLVAEGLGYERLQLFLALDQPVQEPEVRRARELLVQRAQGTPTAYLRGRREFYGRDFRVGPGVLIPRPETELLCDLARERLGAVSRPRLLDVGTGSGCIAVTLALELQGSEVLAVDRSQRALAYARQNAQLLGAELVLWCGDGLGAVRPQRNLDLIVSNPPYVDPAVRGELEPHVRDHEPAEALFAPAGDPDLWVRRLLEEGLPRLRPGGWLLCELGHDQAARALALAGAADCKARVHTDLGGVERVLELSL